MDRKMMNLGRAKKKLRYFPSEESSPFNLKIKDVFSVRDLDHIFDDLDSDPGTPLLSPLPKSPGEDEQNKGSQCPIPKSPIPKSPLRFRGKISPLKPSDVLEAADDLQMDHLNNKGSPLEEIAPIKTSSPIELLAGEGVAADAEKPETSPLLFGIEDEEPVVHDLSKHQMSLRAESIKDGSQGDSESLVSPPSRLEFVKPTKQSQSVTSSTPLKAPEQVCKTSAPEPEEESHTNGRITLSPVVLIQKRQPKPLSEEQPNQQVQEVGLKQSLFQKKLKNALQPKASWFKKQDDLQQPARAPSPHVQEEDFMILEDDSPIRFTIPRKNDNKGNPAPESGSVKPDIKEKPFPKQSKEAENQKDEPKKKRKAKHSKATDMSTKDTEVESAPEEREEEVNEDVGCGGDVRLTPDTSQEADTPVIVEQRPKGKTSKPEQRGGNDGADKIPAEKSALKTKKSAKLPNSGMNTEQEEPVSKTKKKPSKTKSSVKADMPESTDLNSAKPKKQDRDMGAVKNKRAKAQEQVDEEQNSTEPSQEPPEPPEIQRPSTVNKEPASKQRAPKKPGKVKKADIKTKEILVTKELPGPEVDVSAEAPSTSKRKRKPPGEWWLTQQEENNMQEQQHEAVQSSQELKSKRKTQRKAPVLTDSPEQELVTENEEIQNEPVTAHKLPKKQKKSQADKAQSNPASSRNNPKSTGGRRKTKAGAQVQRETTSAPMAEEEPRGDDASGQLSPVACSPLPKQHRLTPGDKRVFDKTYTRDGQSQSARKSSAPLLDATESVPVKRQRKPPKNWWEVPQSQDEAESLETQQQNPSPETSRPQMGPPKSTLRKVTSLQKTLGRGQRKNKTNMINTPKSVKRSLATFDAIYDSGKQGISKESGLGVRQKGRRNLLHSLDDQSEQSSENINNYQQQASSHATFDMVMSGIVPESSAARRKRNPRASNGSNRASDYDVGFKSGPSSLIELEQYEEHEDSDLPSSRIIPQTRFTARVLSDCDLCSPPLKPIVLDNEDWDNLCIWFSHIWPVTSKDGKGISPDDFHWYCHAGRAMGHMVDLQNNTFSSGKILLGSYMKKPAQMDLHSVTVFNVASSCVRVEIDGVKEVYNSGQTFMAPCGQSYSIHNMCQEPAVLWYHRMLPNHTSN